MKAPAYANFLSTDYQLKFRLKIMEGKYAILKEPYMGYRNIQLLCKEGSRWTVEICGSGKIIEVYEDEFIIDA